MCVLLAATVSVVTSSSYGMDLKQLTATQNVVWKQVTFLFLFWDAEGPRTKQNFYTVARQLAQMARVLAHYAS